MSLENVTHVERRGRPSPTGGFVVTLRDWAGAIGLRPLAESHLARDLANRAPDILVEFRPRATPRRMPELHHRPGTRPRRDRVSLKRSSFTSSRMSCRWVRRACAVPEPYEYRHHRCVSTNRNRSRGLAPSAILIANSGARWLPIACQQEQVCGWELAGRHGNPARGFLRPP